jgi:hypothetical protein
MPIQSFREPTVEVGRWHAPIPSFINAKYCIPQSVEAMIGKG